MATSHTVKGLSVGSARILIQLLPVITAEGSLNEVANRGLEKGPWAKKKHHVTTVILGARNRCLPKTHEAIYRFQTHVDYLIDVQWSRWYHPVERRVQFGEIQRPSFFFLKVATILNLESISISSLK